MDSLNNLQINCKKCNVVFGHGDHVVLTSKIDFYHFLCYKSKGKFFRFFNNPINFITWTDKQAMLEEYLKATEDLMKNKPSNATEIEMQQVELQPPKQPDEQELTEIAVQDEEEAIEDEPVAVIEEMKPNLSENLMQLMSEVNELKQQINYFSDEKARDENLIKSLKSQIQLLKMQVQSLRWELNTSSSSKIDSNNNNQNNHNISFASD